MLRTIAEKHLSEWIGVWDKKTWPLLKLLRARKLAAIQLYNQAGE